MLYRNDATNKFLSDDNISYLAYELKTLDPTLPQQMKSFTINHPNLITNTPDVWYTVREMNRAFVHSFDRCISVEDRYSAWGEAEFKNSELRTGELI